MRRTIDKPQKFRSRNGQTIVIVWSKDVKDRAIERHQKSAHNGRFEASCRACQDLKTVPTQT